MPPAHSNQPGPSAWESLLAISDAAPSGTPHLQGRRVVVTGAAGSIGTALTQALAASAPASLLLLDTSESGLYELSRSLNDTRQQPAFVLASVADAMALTRVFTEHHPQVIFHAAAYKHVPLTERNPFAAISNNALGSHTLAQAAAHHGVDQLILLSTDKAADPASIMGASKRIAELACLSAARAGRMRTAVVRLGNVLGTRGSVLPVFQDQLARGAPLTVTHAEAERYFLPMLSAVGALLASLAHTGQASLLAPELGPPLRILDLARTLVARHGGGAPIQVTGMRPGDKLHESLLGAGEAWAAHPDPSGLRAINSPVPAPDELNAALHTLRQAVEGGELPRLLAAVQALVPGYRPSTLLTAGNADAPGRQAACEARP